MNRVVRCIFFYDISFSQLVLFLISKQNAYFCYFVFKSFLKGFVCLLSVCVCEGQHACGGEG